VIPKVDQLRLAEELDALGNISEAPPPVTTRIVFTEADVRGREFVKQLYREANLIIRADPAGNTFARWEGSEPKLAAVGTGSHIDAIPNAGRFDGTVGVLGGLEAIRALQRDGFRPKRSIELVIFTSEEPTRFGIGCLGSRLLSGLLDPSVGTRLKDRDGVSLDEARASGWHRRHALLEEEPNVLGRRAVQITRTEEKGRVHHHHLQALHLERGLLGEELRAVVREARDDADRRLVVLGRDVIRIVSDRDRAARRRHDDALHTRLLAFCKNRLRAFDVDAIELFGVFLVSRDFSRAVKRPIAAGRGFAYGGCIQHVSALRS